MAVLLATPGGAAASPRQETIFDATSYLIGDVTDAQRRTRIRELDRMGVDTLRVVLLWKNLVPQPGARERPAGFNPADPRDYPDRLWAGWDDLIRAADARGLRVLMTLGPPFPRWASAGGRSTIRNPRPAEYRRLVTAVGHRYGGSFRPGRGSCGLPVCPPLSTQPPPLPRVRFWSAWNEPNQDIFLQPQYRQGRPYAGRLYRRLFLAAQAGLDRSGHGRDPLLIAETAPSGGRSSTDPVAFLRGVLCLDSGFRRRRGCEPLDARGWAHHPYSPGLAPFEASTNPGLVNMATLGRLKRALARAARAGATRRRLPIYITEFGVQSVPDRRFGVSLRRQAEYLGIAEHMAWRDRSVRSYGQYLMADDPPSYVFRFTTGLRLHSGRKKPAYRAFPLTLAVRRRGRRVVIWGHLRPGEGRRRVEVRVRDGRRDRRLRVVSTNRRGYFTLRSPYRSGRRWRAVYDGRGGPLIRAYRFR
jgi:hypothetical protein